MKILDRYIIASFLKNYLISFMVLVGLYVVLDMLFNFDELLETTDSSSGGGLLTFVQVGRNALDYYSYQIAWYYIQLAGVIPVVAAAFTLLRFVRFNELSAMMSAGVPLLRIASPIILTALVLNGLLILDQELLIPNVIPKLMRSHDQLHDDATNSYTVPILRDDNGAYFRAERFFPSSQPPAIAVLTVIEPREGRPPRLIKADGARWDDRVGAWRLENGELIESEVDAETRAVPLEVYKTAVTPERIQLSGRREFATMLSTQHINELLKESEARNDLAARAELLKTKHTRFTLPLVNMILLLLAIGAVLTRDPQQIKSAATRCVMLSAACLSVAFVGFQLAGKAPASGHWVDTWPALMAWMPVFIFGPLAVWLLDRVKT